MNGTEALHYLTVLRDHSSPFQPQVREALDYAIITLSRVSTLERLANNILADLKEVGAQTQ